jgi:hypothetical protein
MNKREHVVNGALLSVGLSALFTAPVGWETVRFTIEIGVPIMIGTLLPDVDTVVGSHRKTLHNLLFLVIMIGFPIQYNNLYFVWLGVLSHYVLDMLGNVRGMALLYPYPTEFDVPIGIEANSVWALPITLFITLLEVFIASYILVLPVSPESIAQVQQFLAP